MKIETKFDIGDKVWVIIFNGAEKWDIDCSDVRGTWPISLITINEKKQLRYWIEDCEEEERNVFRTKKEAQAECNRRNTKESV